jgi:hypothetical protein
LGSETWEFAAVLIYGCSCALAAHLQKYKCRERDVCSCSFEREIERELLEKAG